MEDASAGTAEEAPLYGEPGMPIETAWPQSLITALYEQHADPAQLIAAACAQIGLAQAPDYRVEPVAEQDWVRRSQSQFEPIRIFPLDPIPLEYRYADKRGKTASLSLEPALPHQTSC